MTALLAVWTLEILASSHGWMLGLGGKFGLSLTWALLPLAGGLLLLRVVNGGPATYEIDAPDMDES